MVKAKIIKCPYVDVFVYLTAQGASAGIPESLAEHIEGCILCKKIMQERDLQRTLLSKIRAAGIPEAVVVKFFKSSEIEQGQVWQVKTLGEDFFLGIVLSKNGEGVKIAPLTSDFKLDEISDSDIILGSMEPPLGLPFLVEWWNEKLVTIDRLVHCYGHIDPGRLLGIKAAAEVGTTRVLSETRAILEHLQY